MSGTAVVPPRRAERILERLIGTSTSTGSILGDLREDFQLEVERRGLRGARRWYWRQALRLGLRMRVGSTVRGASHDAEAAPRSAIPLVERAADVGRDLRFALRGLAKARGVTVIAGLSLALGIAVNVTAFAGVHATFLRPVPGVSGADHVAELLVSERGSERQEWSLEDFEAVAEAETPFEAVAGWKSREGAVTGPDGSERVRAMYVSASYFPVLGVSAATGRTFTRAEERAHTPVVVISHRMWLDRLGGAPDVVGASIDFNRVPHTVVGVAPEMFRGHRPLGESVELWVPLTRHPMMEDEGMGRRGSWILTLARLRPGARLDQANAALASIMTGLQAGEVDPATARTARALAFGPFPAQDRAADIAAVTALLALVGLVLTIICGNVAGMLIARNARRAREFAVRVALGAGKARLAGMLVIEALLLAGIGGVLGTGLAFAIVRVAGPSLFDSTGMAGGPGVEPMVLTYAVAATLGATLLIGLLPAIRSSRPEMLRALKDDAGGGGRRVGRVHRIAASAQSGVALFLVATSILYVRALGGFGDRDLGFDPGNLVVVSLDLSLEGAESPEEGLTTARRITDAVNGVPGVVSVALADGLPLDLVGNFTTAVSAEGAAAEPVPVEFTRVDEGFFAAVGTPVLRGRAIEASDAGGAPVVVITEPLGERLWPGQDPVGRSIEIPLSTAGEHTAYTIVGVTPDVVGSRPTGREPHIFVPLAQSYSARMVVLARTREDPAGLIRPIQNAVLEADSRLSLPPVVTSESLVSRGSATQRQTAGIAGALGLLALALAAIGVYGVIAFWVASRTREIGLRMALGASRTRVLDGVLRDTVRLALPGLVVGGGAAAAVAAASGDTLLGLSPADPLTYLTALAALIVVVVAAGAIPARRASGVDPVEALRAE